jgi:hypothetical protein
MANTERVDSGTVTIDARRTVDDTSIVDRSSILPPPPIDDSGRLLEVIHDREYRVRAYKKSSTRVLIRGAVRDQKPAGLYFADDPNPLTIHHMMIDIEVDYPSFEIVAANTVIDVHPHGGCQDIVGHYDKLVGLSIARGFTHKVRELFGGPRGCTHTTALIQAMAPVAMQCIWSLRASEFGAGGTNESVTTNPSADPSGPTPDQQKDMWRVNLNTCHVWAEDGEWVQQLQAGTAVELPIWAEERMVELGIKPDQWRSKMRG